MSKSITVVLMRGAPGSGKSTQAEKIFAHCTSRFDPSCPSCDINGIVSADHFFTNPVTGEYKFDGTRLPEAHGACLRNFTRALVTAQSEGFGAVIIVDNTNTKIAHMDVYVQLARAFGATIKIVECDGRFQNIHGVPSESVTRMRSQMEPLPKSWEAWRTTLDRLLTSL